MFKMSTRLLIMTSNSLRHNYLVNALSRHYEVVGVLSEGKGKYYADSANESILVREHLEGFNQTEAKYFASGQDIKIAKRLVLIIPRGELNSASAFDFVRKHRPDYIILFGTGLLKDPILSEFGKRIINLHLGLSPYYRGSATNFWPLVNNEPECVGATIHLASKEVDAGEILSQVRPDIELSDTCHDIGCKAIVAGVARLIDCIWRYQQGLMLPIAQQSTVGKTFKKSDFKENALRILSRNFEQGMIRKYLSDKATRDRAFPIGE